MKASLRVYLGLDRKFICHFNPFVGLESSGSRNLDYFVVYGVKQLLHELSAFKRSLINFSTLSQTSEMIIFMGMESRWPKFISLSYLILPLLIAVTIFHLCGQLAMLKLSFIIYGSASREPLSYTKVAFWTQHGGERSNYCSW